MYTPLQNLRLKDAFLLISGIEQYFHAGSPEGATAVLGGCAIDALLEPTAPSGGVGDGFEEDILVQHPSSPVATCCLEYWPTASPPPVAKLVAARRQAAAATFSEWEMGNDRWWTDGVELGLVT